MPPPPLKTSQKSERKTCTLVAWLYLVPPFPFTSEDKINEEGTFCTPVPPTHTHTFVLPLTIRDFINVRRLGLKET